MTSLLFPFNVTSIHHERDREGTGTGLDEGTGPPWPSFCWHCSPSCGANVASPPGSSRSVAGPGQRVRTHLHAVPRRPGERLPGWLETSKQGVAAQCRGTCTGRPQCAIAAALPPGPPLIHGCGSSRGRPLAGQPGTHRTCTLGQAAREPEKGGHHAKSPLALSRTTRPRWWTGPRSRSRLSLAAAKARHRSNRSEITVPGRHVRCWRWCWVVCRSMRCRPERFLKVFRDRKRTLLPPER